jgi:hypothetical protein
MRKAFSGLFAFAALLAASDAALAHGRGRAHFYFGPAWYWGPTWYYPPPAYYYPPPQPAAPPVYVERIDPAESGWWYYCEQSRGYYPYVKECPSGWQRVSPSPAPAAAQ